jgi:tetratricopeptide (TPR) repeat protein
VVRALARIEKGADLQDAMRDAEEAARRLVDDPFALYARGRARLFGQDPQAAIRDASQAVTTLKGFYHAFELRAAARYLARNYLDAQDDLKRCQEIKPDFWRAFVTSGRIRTQKQDFEGAIKDYSSALEKRKNDPDLWTERGWARLQKQLFREALSDFDEALRLDPRHMLAIRGRVFSLFNQGDQEAGFRELERAIALSEADGKALRGTILYQLGQWQAALDDLTRAMQLQPALRAQLEPFARDARRRLQGTEATDPKDWRGFLRRAEGFVGSRNYPEAQKDFLRAFRMIPSDLELTEQDRTSIMVGTYNLACTYSVAAKSLQGDEKRAAMDNAFTWLERSAKWGFMEYLASSCPHNPQRHSGKEHTAHDEDFEAIREDPRFKAILEKKEEYR